MVAVKGNSQLVNPVLQERTVHRDRPLACYVPRTLIHLGHHRFALIVHNGAFRWLVRRHAHVCQGIIQ